VIERFTLRPVRLIAAGLLAAAAVPPLAGGCGGRDDAADQAVAALQP
jgi:hypothetical protein